jgi:pimeloyl-ACP methyl ester carboxylesterase
MITVRIVPTIIERALTDGVLTPAVLIVHGLPRGSRLASARFDYARELLVFEFLDPEPGPDREIAIWCWDLREGPGPSSDRTKPLHPLDRYLDEA